MNPYINIALIVWTLLLAYSSFLHAAERLGRKQRAGVALVISFLSLFTALLGIGQYLN